MSVSLRRGQNECADATKLVERPSRRIGIPPYFARLSSFPSQVRAGHVPDLAAGEEHKVV